ncbi:MAG: hypothetical protein ACYCQI_07915 [Gammaproteobacteria bacterium]
MNKIMLILSVALTICLTSSVFADTSCPDARFIKSLIVNNADPHDSDGFWDAQTNNFGFTGHSWNVNILNFKSPAQSELAAMKAAQFILRSTPFIANPKKVRSPDNANNICIYVWNGSFGRDLVIMATEY